MRGVWGDCGGAICGAGGAGAGWDAGRMGAVAGSGGVAGGGWVIVFGLAAMSALAGELAAGTVGAVSRRTCPLAVFWSCCWCMARVVNTPTMVTAFVRQTNRNLFERAQWEFI